MALKLLSVNVEQDKHLSTVKDIIDRENADVVALMEVREEDLDNLLAGYPNRLFRPNFHDKGHLAGVVIASQIPFTESHYFYCDSEDDGYVPPHGIVKGVHRPLVVWAYVKDVMIGATHFTWTPDMSETEKQYTHLNELLLRLAGTEFVLCGDFNIPRGNGAYRLLAGKYTDNIPAEVTTTIDPLLHKANQKSSGKLTVVVDYVWSTPSYTVQNVRVIDGVSDHCALVSDIVMV